jgi:hypothetical protein
MSCIGDATDYVAWRKGVTVQRTEYNYNLWRTHFGWTFAGTGGSSAPESATFLLLAISALASVFCFRRK